MGPLSKLLVESLVQTVQVVVALGSVAGIAIGTLLIVDSARVFRINQRLGRWFSTRAWVQPLEAPRKLDLPIYRQHRIVGIALAAWALYALYVVTFSYSTGGLRRLFGGAGPSVMLEVVLESARVLLIVLNAFVLAIGAALAIRPKLVQAIEKLADRHYSTHQYVKPLDDMHTQPDEFVRGHPKLVGALLVAGSAFLVAHLGLRFLA